MTNNTKTDCPWIWWPIPEIKSALKIKLVTELGMRNLDQRNRKGLRSRVSQLGGLSWHIWHHETSCVSVGPVFVAEHSLESKLLLMYSLRLKDIAGQLWHATMTSLSIILVRSLMGLQNVDDCGLWLTRQVVWEMLLVGDWSTKNDGRAPIIQTVHCTNFCYSLSCHMTGNTLSHRNSSAKDAWWSLPSRHLCPHEQPKYQW